MVIDVTPEAYWKAFASMLVYVAIRTLVALYNNDVAPDNAPVPLVPSNTLVIHDTLIPDFPYNGFGFIPGMILGLKPSSSVDSSNMAVVIPEVWNAFKPMLVTEDGIVMEVRPVIP